MCALMGKGKASLAAELLDLSGLNKAGVHQNLIFPERDGSLHAHLFRDILGIRIGGQTTDASIRGKMGKRHFQAKVFLGELVNRCPSCHSSDVLGFAAEKELIEILGYGYCNFFDFLLG